MRNKFNRYLILILLVSAWACSLVGASNIEGTATYKDYIFVLVHGLNADANIFTAGTDFGNLKAYLENSLGLSDRVFAYNFSNNRGDNTQLAKELGDRDYFNPRFDMNGQCWLEKARDEFVKKLADKKYKGDISRVLPSEVPTKYILITHCMGGLAARHYIYGRGSDGKRYYRNDKVVRGADEIFL